MNGYKLSRYNVRFTRNKKNYLWNTLTDALILLDDNGSDYLDRFNDGANNDCFFDMLKQNGCIVDERYDELGKVLFDEKSTMLNDTPVGMHYTIAPGLGCNYHCPYCFEKDRSIHTGMTVDVINKVCEFIIKAAESNPYLRQIGVTWFGGEPLLYVDTIQSISERLIKYCNERKIIYSAGIVTNGRFLTKEVATRLKNLHVNYVQLAIDGMKEHYSKSKGTNPEDFDSTVQNLIASADIIPITVRINVTNSLEEASKLTEYLLKDQQLDGRIKIYVAHVRDYDETNMDKEKSSHKRFLEMERRYLADFIKGGSYSFESLSFIKPKRRCTTCLSVCNPNYCIGPEGEFYRCEHFFGKREHIVGTVESGRFYSKDEIICLKHIHPEQCEQCEMLPICLGGCINDTKENKTALACEQFKERLIDYLLLNKESEDIDK